MWPLLWLFDSLGGCWPWFSFVAVVTSIAVSVPLSRCEGRAVIIAVCYINMRFIGVELVKVTPTS